ncbi:class I SAM-dependent methyltransferase [Hymenobacter taeanensis]|uniref:Class I SAM-dependent methyltransferase n=1 Tax=Hymenobacter taeanensis TaxID=2735321 RepID=A0A6M6BJL4_9BACT|nr:MULTISPECIES: class I SAM-dependent methyltransferase [Hymenobacter]QJX48058.1 class I SAM-dependent methyltransferase [Hymenobacter taeanensis]UOQ82489.1 class I SAM-dependent methyltransferase [Hymenobacter sp. 5414T-23]
MATAPDYISLNRALWNAKTEHHLHSAFYDVAGFRAGRTSLQEIELALLGQVSGQRVLHLQCHFGLDTLSLARMGATVVGVDLSDEAIRTARQLAEELQLPARFVCCDLYSLPEHLPAEPAFDVVYTTYGVLGWLPDLDRWAAVVGRYLKPGGRLVLVEFHPVVWMFNGSFTEVQYSYFNRETIEETETGTYANRAAPITTTSVSWNHGLGEVLGSLRRQGLQLHDFQEYDYSPYNCFSHTVEVEPGRYQIEPLRNKLPLVYSVVAEKPSVA